MIVVPNCDMNKLLKISGDFGKLNVAEDNDGICKRILKRFEIGEFSCVAFENGEYKKVIKVDEIDDFLGANTQVEEK